MQKIPHNSELSYPWTMNLLATGEVPINILSLPHITGPTTENYVCTKITCTPRDRISVECKFSNRKWFQSCAHLIFSPALLHMISEQPVRHYLSQIAIITYIMYDDDDDDNNEDNNNRILHNAHKLTNGALCATTVMFYASL
jgi:hypothetical protein